MGGWEHRAVPGNWHSLGVGVGEAKIRVWVPTPTPAHTHPHRPRPRLSAHTTHTQLSHTPPRYLGVANMAYVCPYTPLELHQLLAQYRGLFDIYARFMDP